MRALGPPTIITLRNPSPNSILLDTGGCSVGPTSAMYFANSSGGLSSDVMTVENGATKFVVDAMGQRQMRPERRSARDTLAMSGTEHRAQRTTYLLYLLNVMYLVLLPPQVFRFFFKLDIPWRRASMGPTPASWT